MLSIRTTLGILVVLSLCSAIRANANYQWVNKTTGGYLQEYIDSHYFPAGAIEPSEWSNGQPNDPIAQYWYIDTSVYGGGDVLYMNFMYPYECVNPQSDPTYCDKNKPNGAYSNPVHQFKAYNAEQDVHQFDYIKFKTQQSSSFLTFEFKPYDNAHVGGLRFANNWNKKPDGKQPSYPTPNPVPPYGAPSPTPPQYPTPTPNPVPPYGAPYDCKKDQNCIQDTCHSNGCDQCKDGYFKKDYIYPCEPCSQFQNCRSCQDFHGCGTCNEGYYNENPQGPYKGGCKPCDQQAVEKGWCPNTTGWSKPNPQPQPAPQPYPVTQPSPVNNPSPFDWSGIDNSTLNVVEH